MAQQSKPENIEFKIDLINDKLQSIMKLVPIFTELAEGTTEIREHIANQLMKFSFSMNLAKLDKDELEQFMTQPYYIHREKGLKENEWLIAIPKIFEKVHLGWLYKTTPSHNVFLVNRFAEWFGDLPAYIKHEIGLKDPLDIQLTVDKKYLVGKDLDKAHQQYAGFVVRKDGNKLELDPKKYFQFLSTLINDGIMPFSKSPIPKEHFVRRTTKFDLRPYQVEAWDKLCEYSNIGVYYPPSTGKTFIGMYAMANIKVENKPWLIVVPRTTLIEQWYENIEDWTDLTKDDIIVCTYQMAIKKYMDTQFTGMIIDESHHMPSDYFVHMFKIQRHYTIGLTATPQREDGREDYIIALTGKAVGLSWDYFKKLKYITEPESHIWIVKNDADRLRKLQTIVDSDTRPTLIFSDSLKMGEQVKKQLGIEFIHGETRDKLKKLRDNLKEHGIVAASRIADEGVSLSVERVIEVSWLFGSRHQELQRMTRILHNPDKNIIGIHHVIMTADEWNHDHKRFYSLMDKGFKIVMHREGEKEKTFTSNTVTEQPKPRQSTAQKIAQPPKTDLAKVKFETSHSVLKLPGVLKLAAKLKPVEMKAVDIFYSMPNESFTAKSICRKLGYENLKNSNIRMGQLIELGFIKLVNKNEYQASPKTLGG